jgi:hypothetical protein
MLVPTSKQRLVSLGTTRNIHWITFLSSNGRQIFMSLGRKSWMHLGQ